MTGNQSTFMSDWLSDYSQKSAWRAVGLMSGTSLDGIDAACIQISGEFPHVRIELLGFVTHGFAPALRERIMSVCENGRVEDLARLDVELGDVFADAVLKVLSACALRPDEIDVVGSHGQTVCHLPDARATLQIGQSSIIAERTGRIVVSDFRTGDMAVGGQGAPLVPFIDWLLLRDSKVHRIVQNIGGIANLTWLRAGGTLDDVRAWDTGPGNMVIDQCVRIASGGHQDYDEDGIRAAQGEVDEAWLYEHLQHPFFAKPAPKSAGREEFGRAFAIQFYEEGLRRKLQPNDIIATATALTARSIGGAYQTLWKEEKLDPTQCEALIAGGGAYNPTLWRMLEVQTAPIRLRRMEELSMRSDAKEAIAFALLAHAAMLGVPNTVPHATGAERAVVAGKITPPKVL